jgi:hypothetical protein
VEIIDAHVHLLSYADGEYPLITDELGSQNWATPVTWAMAALN